MINELFKSKFPFAYNYFSSLIEPDNQNRFPQSIIFEGADCKSSFYFALELARVLNCKNDTSQNCDCIDCKWIKSYSHPAIVNVSQIHFKPDGDETKTQISVKQAREIEKALTLSSDYHRFYIFFSSKNVELEDNVFGYSPIDFSIEPLNQKIFNLSTANALLKSVEEPPKNTTFVFLAKSREDILSTIVSRSQVFKMSAVPEFISYFDVQNLFNDYFNLDYLNAIKTSENILNYMNDNNVELEVVLNKLIAYLKDILKQNINDTALFQKINRDIGFISDALKHSRASMQSKIILEALFLRITRGLN